jgi:hypothetical protein
VLSLK